MAAKKGDLSGFGAMADSEPLYERFETEEGHLIEIVDSMPGETTEDGVWVRLTRKESRGTRSTAIYLDHKAQMDLGLALIANLKE